LNSAVEVEDYEPIRKGELEFDKGEIEKIIEIRLAEKDEDDLEDEEIFIVFGVRLFDP
jgi:hypothetical protein